MPRQQLAGPGGASLGLPAPNFATGWGPGFAFEANSADRFSLVDRLTDFDTVYALDGTPVATGITVAEDNEWFEWDPARGPFLETPATTPSLKHSGFYYTEFGLNLDGPTTEPCLVFLTPAHKPFIPAGLDRGNFAAIVALQAGPVGLSFDLAGNTAEPTYASLALVPLFTP